MITLIGPTASGKTSLAVALAHDLESEVISADSRQVYRGMDLGTGKDLSEYNVEGVEIPFHLIDIVPAGEKYNLFRYQQDFHAVYQDMLRRGVKTPIFCGGSGLYVEAILRDYNLPDVPQNPELRADLALCSHEALVERLKSYAPLHNTTDISSKQRTIRAIEIADYIQKYGQKEQDKKTLKSEVFCLALDRDERRRRISLRLKQRLEAGMLEEVRVLMKQGLEPKDLIYYGLEYKFLTEHLIGKLSYQEMYERLEIAIHQFAKRQMTWFRGMERRGIKINYIDALLPLEEKIAQVKKIYAQRLS